LAIELRRRAPELLLPSLGEPIQQDTDGALAALQVSLERLCAGRPSEKAFIDVLSEDRLEQITDHVYMSAHSEAVSWYLISDSGKALVIDYGYRGSFGARRPPAGKVWHWPTNPSRSRRRVLLHGIDPLSELGIDGIDVVLVSHFHDDHVAGVPLLQRCFATLCWVPENFASLLENPDAHAFPCDWPQPIRVDRRLPLDQPFAWEEFEFQLAPMSGHTRFSAAISFRADGKHFAHTGDQFFLMDRDGAPASGDWANAAIDQNHVYRNGASLESYRETAALLRRWRPDLVLSGHRPPMHTDDAFFALLDGWGDQFAQLHRSAMVLGEDETHFGLDSWGGWIWPYRIHIREGEPVRTQVTVRNPRAKEATLTVRLVGPARRRGTSVRVPAGPREEVSCELSILPTGPCRRQPIAAELLIGERSVGQVAEALVTVGGSHF
jgi:glyoxylase-like metal-dependent hydrolase (beta-lactamase superfamily II)